MRKSKKGVGVPLLPALGSIARSEGDKGRSKYDEVAVMLLLPGLFTEGGPDEGRS